MTALSSALRAAAEERGWKWIEQYQYKRVPRRPRIYRNHEGNPVAVEIAKSGVALTWIVNGPTTGLVRHTVPCPSPSDLPAALDRCWEEARKALGQ